MKKEDSWTSEYRKKKFYENQELKALEKLKKPFSKTNESKIPKTIAVMLDLQGTTDYIDDKKAKKFIEQLDIIRKRFGAEIGTISVSTHYDTSYSMLEVLDILSHNLSDNIKIGISFYYDGTYDYDNAKETFCEYGFNSDKVEVFAGHYVNSIGMNNQWFAIIDDSISEDTYKRYQNKHPMLVCRPSKNESSLKNNNFMSIATTTKGFAGVIEVFDSYIESIKDLSPEQILKTQKNMISRLSSYNLTKKVENREYAFLERYLKEGLADDGDYQVILDWIMYTNDSDTPSKEELIYLKKIFEIMSEYYKTKNEEKNIERILKLQRTFEISSN